ncbi:glutathione synthetase [Polytolypa hystricis UAMH7299]|uniref:Glutathione synthetase n=1 Tax=Polytolypa hystricis (strain UAMH7299) TaxID=1447883 RepID=A0A2B7YQ19_POLH7|nr:glutathione synthetase [Polytolypa hystricis UAMH7299]
MDDSIYTSYPPQLTPEQKEYLVGEVKNWALHHGLAVKPPPTFIPKESDPVGVLSSNAPVTLFPSPFPRSGYESAVAVQTTYNKLYAAISSDEAWLGKIIEELVEADDFIANLWKIHVRVKEEGYVQPLSLGLFRSDYMVHTPQGSTAPSLKQVEFNTISSSFGGLSSLVSAMHTDFLSFPPENPITYPAHPILKDNVPPDNSAVATLTGGLAAAHEAYGPSKSSPALPLCILFIVQDGERNLFDQFELSTRLTKFHEIPVFRVTTKDVLKSTSIPSTNPSRPLIYTPLHAPSVKFEATTIYLRGFYGPGDYPDETGWDARTHLERSAAIKCPSVLSQLSGCKKVQQILAEATGPDHLAHLLSGTDPKLVSQVRETFAPQYDLSVSGRGRELALDPSTAATHVLKPQREGGGNNIYRESIPAFLRSIPEKDWKGYILMELIQPPTTAKNMMLRSDGQVLSGHVIGELGVFGTILWKDDGEVLHNDQGGWLMRTKGKDSDEGGVAAGFSSLDSILLV